ncbi:MAG: tRNA pseudouridine(38-40) synthase TruA [Methanobacteriaceae archaeon]|nr:tRNA pseudouridine(38-40) synthase TruA [Methanobacteriaceae archaeon]
MKRFALKIAYLGTDFHGFQRQPELRTVEGELIKAFKKSGVIRDTKTSEFSIAGRTDRGVHALGNVVAFNTDYKFRINYLNSFLPDDMRIIAISKVLKDFNPRFAIQRHYRYLMPLNFEVDLELMKKASTKFEGTHNFQNFSKKSERNPTRKINRLEISINNNFLEIDVYGESFLWNMVRKIVTVLLMIGRNQLSLLELNKLFNPSLRGLRINIQPVPAQGLTLMNVEYHNLDFEYDDYAREKFFKFLNKKYLYHYSLVLAEQNMMDFLKNHIKNY